MFENLERKIFNTIVDYATQKAHEDYGIERNEGDYPTWNNESDAFKHTYLSWFLSWFIDDEYDILNKPHPNCKCTIETVYY